MAKTTKKAKPGGKAPKTKLKRVKVAPALAKPKAKPKLKAKVAKVAKKPKKAPKVVRMEEARVLTPFAAPASAAQASVLDDLWQVVEARRASGDVQHSHSARLLSRGTAKVAQKLGEEAVECVIEAATGNRPATVLESADLLYHLVVVWVDAGIRPEEVWAELARRQGISGIAEKAARPQGLVRAAGTTKLP